jgi:hypothetical protein
MARKCEYDQVIDLLCELRKKYPSYNMGRHLATALDGYSDLWGITDKEFLFAITKYTAELELNSLPDDDAFMKKVMHDADHIFDKETFEEYDDEEDYLLK